MNSKQKLHQARLQDWAIKFADQKAQGLSNKEWCELNHISINSYNYWKRLLKDEIVDQMLPDIVPLTLPTPITHTEALSTPFFSEELKNSTNCTTFQFNVNGFNFKYESEVSPDFLCTLLKAVKYA